MAVEVLHRTGDDAGGRRAPVDASASSGWWDRDAPGPDDKYKAGDVPQVHAAQVPYIQRLQRAWSRHELYDRVFDRIYSNRTLRNYHQAIAALSSAGYTLGRLMVTTSIVDTFVSRFARRRPMPAFVVDEAEWDLKRRAIEARKFLHGKMRQTETDRLSDLAVLHAAVRGTGILYVDDGEEDVVVEPVHRWELFVDPFEARSGMEAVRQIHRVRRVAREVLAHDFPEWRERIRAAQPSRTRPGETGQEDWTCPAGFHDASDVIDLYESWHLPSGKNAGDGRVARSLEGCTLEFCQRDESRFPFAILRRHLRPEIGFWGQGDVERLAPLQHDINQMARDIQQNIEAGGKLIVFTNEQNEAVPTEKLTGVRPLRIRVKGPLGSIQYHAPLAVQPAHQQILDSRIGYARDLSGVADWAASARSPLGAGASGVAIDTMEDLQSDRHSTFESRLSHFRCDLGHLIVGAMRRLVARRRRENGNKKSGYEAVWMDAGTLQRMAYDEIEIEEDRYRLEIEPISHLPTTRAGKLAVAKELIDGGIMPRWVAAGLFEEPDIAHANRIVLAKYHNCERMMGILGDPKKPMPTPLPYHDLELLLQFALAYFNRAECDRAPSEVLSRYSQFIDAVDHQIKEGKGPGPGTIPDIGPQTPDAAMMPPDMPMPGMPGMPGAPMPEMPPGMPGMAPPLIA